MTMCCRAELNVKILPLPLDGYPRGEGDRALPVPVGDKPRYLHQVRIASLGAAVGVEPQPQHPPQRGGGEGAKRGDGERGGTTVTDTGTTGNGTSAVGGATGSAPTTATSVCVQDCTQHRCRVSVQLFRILPHQLGGAR